MTYRADPVTQRDGSQLQNSNCLMAAAAVGLDYHTLGAKTSTGARMRDYSGDTSGGTNTDEIERAWKTGYNEDPATRDGRPWSDVLEDLEAGRLVMLQVWHATVGGPCLSGSGAYGHGLAVAPERDGSRWLVADPWCKPPSWKWIAEDKLKRGAEEWYGRCLRHAGGPGVWEGLSRHERGLVVRALFRLHTPAHPAPADEPPGAGGSSGVLFASTKPHGGDDVAINTNGSHLAVDRRVTLTAEAGFYADAAFTDQYGTLAEGRVLPLLGPALGTNAYAVLVDTSKPYDDGVDRPSVVYVSKSKATDPYTVEPEPGPPSDDVEAALAARDLEWREWLDAAPGEVLSTAQAVVAWGELAPDQD